MRFDQIREQTTDVRGVRCGVMKSIIGKRPHGGCEDAKQGTSSAGAGGEHQFKRQFAHVEVRSGGRGGDGWEVCKCVIVGV